MAWANRDSGVSMLFISHNLNVVRKLCGRVAVMQRGTLVEEGETDTVAKGQEALQPGDTLLIIKEDSANKPGKV